MRIQIINPNTTAAMTQRMVDAVRPLAAPGTELIARTSTFGPPSIEGHYDEAMSVPGLIEQIRLGEADGVDGHIIACFGDPGLAAAREVARAPVIGIAEAAMHAAALVATGFSIVTTLGRTKIIARHLVETYGMAARCRGIHAVEIAVLDLEDNGSDTEERLIDACRRAVVEDECGAIILGCAGMADLVARVSAAIDVPVIDGVAAAVKFIEALAGMGLRTSKHGDYAAPLAKSFTAAARLGIA